MFGSTILDVAIGLALVYLLLSLIASAVREFFEGIVKSRAVQLERGIRELLDDRNGEGLAKTFYEHPLIASLYRGAFEAAESRFHGRNLPTYIPSKNFTDAVLDMAIRGPNVGPYAALQTHPVLTVDALRQSIGRIPSPFVQHALLTAVDGAQGDMQRVRLNLAAWYDSAMDRVSGWYKRRTQFWLFVIGLGVALTLNVNSFVLADYLAHNPAARAALVSRAEAIRHDSTYRRLVADSTQLDAAAARAVYDELQSANLPIGWNRLVPPPRGVNAAGFWFMHFSGLLMTAFAITLGAPFWFDLLNKFMIVRSTVKPHQKSPEESSEDRQSAPDAAAGAAAAAAGVPNAPPNAPPGAPPGAAPNVPANAPLDPGPVAAPNGPPPADLAVVPPHVDREWADGDPNEGIL